MLELAECDLADVVRDVQALLEAPLRESGSTVDVQLQPARGVWDRARLMQVVTNLVTNALKYGGGTPISIRVGSDGQTARLVVEDRGPGIPVSERERVLRPYERVAGATSAQGLGLGLYIAAEIVKAHGGTIRIEGEDGRGARFVIELPVTPP
jgi:signal transduction histidine kinase